MPVSTQRQNVRFASGDADCAAWYRPGVNGACVIMAGGIAVTKEPAADRFGARFADAGFGVLAFDYRRFGESGGLPRQVVRLDDQVADWRAAVAFAARQPGVDPGRIALWGFSLSGGHVLRAAADDPRVGAVIAQSPLVDGRAVTPNALRAMTPSALLRLLALGVADALGGLLGRAPLLIPTAGARGDVASLTTPDAMDGDLALDPDGRYADWDRTVAARVALRIGNYRPAREAARVRCPLLMVVCDQDRSALPGPALDAAATVPHSEIVHLTGRHYAPFLEAHEQAVAAELAFLRKHLTDSAGSPAAQPVSWSGEPG
ncbi:alpha/beta hydrolase [Streptacidiphilus rugosus]|uniref:alpha/beta hydrolase n=1 Tax=Streptacidiphilus rugosus TaxID=405783 RepID=UPI000691ACC8|nr:alpha/beta fold hydrolase [Streptacidiphilus rugosus]